MQHWILSPFLPLLMFGAVASAQSAPGTAPGIVLQIKALKTNTGTVSCELHDNEKSFPNKPERAIAQVKARPIDGTATCIFANVPAGRYAVAVWHDVNANQKLDTNLIGIPKEPVGSSNNAKGRFGPPKFKDAAFQYRPPSLQQTIRLE